MNDDVKKLIEEKARLKSLELANTTVGLYLAYTAGATEFYWKGDKDGYDRALSDIVFTLKELAERTENSMDGYALFSTTKIVQELRKGV